MKYLILYIIIFISGANCNAQIDYYPDKIILPKIGDWSPESTSMSHTSCKNIFSDSLAPLADSIQVFNQFSNPITSKPYNNWRISSDSLIIDFSGVFCLNFSNTIEWRLDFMNRPVYAHECFDLENKSEFHLNTALKKLAGSNQEYCFVRNGKETWLVIRNRMITMLGNYIEGIDRVYYLKDSNQLIKKNKQH